METLISVLQVVHVINAVLMAWPFYALVAVNQRGKMGPPLGDRVDIYMENIIKNRTLPCFVFQGTALVTGAAIVLLRGKPLTSLVTEPVLACKFFPLLLIGGLLSYVSLSLQPSIDGLFAQAAGIACAAGTGKTDRQPPASPQTACHGLSIRRAVVGDAWRTGLGCVPALAHARVDRGHRPFHLAGLRYDHAVRLVLKGGWPETSPGPQRLPMVTARMSTGAGPAGRDILTHHV